MTTFWASAQLRFCGKKYKQGHISRNAYSLTKEVTMSRQIIFLIVLSLSLMGSLADAQNTKQEKTALATAEQWLLLRVLYKIRI
jgi:hypothetical protein